MRLSKDKVIKREARAIELFKTGMEIAKVNDTLFQEDGMRMALNRLYELRDESGYTKKTKPEVAKPADTAVENPDPFHKPVVLETNDPNAFSKKTTLFQGKIVTVELMEKK